MITEKENAMPELIEQQFHSLDATLRKRESILREVICGEPAVSAGERRAELYTVAGDEADVAVADLLSDVENAIVIQQIAELCDVEVARARLDERTYGICCGCGENIGFLRLAAYPVAKRCAVCQTRYEQGRRRARQPTL